MAACVEEEDVRASRAMASGEKQAARSLSPWTGHARVAGVERPPVGTRRSVQSELGPDDERVTCEAH